MEKKSTFNMVHRILNAVSERNEWKEMALFLFYRCFYFTSREEIFVEI